MVLKKIILSSKTLTNFTMKLNRIKLKYTKKITYNGNAFIGISTICEGSNGFGANSFITSSFIGFGSYIAKNTVISKTKIGRYCSIGPNVNCIFGKHPSNTFVSTHPSFFSLNPPINFTYTKTQLFEEFSKPIDKEKKYNILIGNDVWIGANVSIMDGVIIGDGAIIAANSLINKNVSDYSIMGGVPAKLIKKRFNENHIIFLQKIKWWDKSKEWISENAKYFKNVEILKKNFLNEN